MKIKSLLFAAGFTFNMAAMATTHGVAVQVNEGMAIPTVAQLQAVLSPGDSVRDMLGWSHVDTACNLATNSSAQITIPARMQQLYANVVAAGGKNFVTLGFNNVHCGQVSDSGSATFPNTPALRAEFAAYAAQVVTKVPSLSGISIWNELNGSYDGHYATISAKLIDYCKLVNAVVASVRAVNRTIPIGIGATVGWNIDGYYINMFGEWGCTEKGDPTIWLDVHPYLNGKISPLNGKTDFALWNSKIKTIRAAGVSNPLVATEWGGPAATTWMSGNPGGNYIQTFENQVIASDKKWMSTMYFLAVPDPQFPGESVIDATGQALTPIGVQYVNQYVN